MASFVRGPFCISAAFVVYFFAFVRYFLACIFAYVASVVLSGNSTYVAVLTGWAGWTDVSCKQTYSRSHSPTIMADFLPRLLSQPIWSYRYNSLVRSISYSQLNLQPRPITSCNNKCIKVRHRSQKHVSVTAASNCLSVKFRTRWHIKSGTYTRLCVNSAIGVLEMIGIDHCSVIPRLHDQAIIKQTSSKHRADIEQTSSN